MFEVLTELGQGTFGDVFLVQKKDTLERFALKILNKDFMVKKNRVSNVYREKEVLIAAGSHPQIVSLKGSF